MSAAAVFVDLVLLNGGLVRIECPARFEDDLHVTLHDAMSRGDTWSPDRFDGASATYLGIRLDSICMNQVMGSLG